MSSTRLAVLVSGGGTTLQNILDRIAAGTLDAEVALVISSSAGAGGVARAAAAGLPCEVVEWTGPDGAAEFSEVITRHVDAAAVNLVVLGGFLRLWNFPARYEGRVMNIHPALLPAFGGTGMYGMRVHRAVVRSGTKVSGCTVHFASRVYDEGPMILQRTVPVRWEDTPEDVQKRVFAEECAAYPDAIQLFAEGRLEIADGRVRVLDSTS